MPFGADEPLYAAAVGPNWTTYYRDRCAARAAGGPAWMWNWAAALIPFWMSFRRLSIALPAHFAQVVGYVAIALFGHEVLGPRWAVILGVAIPIGATALLQGGLGTWLVARRTRAVAAAARRRHGDDTAAAVATITRRAPRLTPGAMTAHVVAGMILFLLYLTTVSMFAPHGHDLRRPYQAAARASLRDHVTFQEAVFADSGHYTTTPDTALFTPMHGVTITVMSASATGFHVRATHWNVPDWECEVVVTTPPRPDTLLNVTPQCRDVRRP
jgi:hypothetical protein